MKRKGFALLLGIILTLICYPAFAQDTVTIQDSIYTLNKTEQTATLIAGKTGEDGTLTIPDTINTEGTDYTVNAIGPNAFTKDLKELTVGKNVTTFDEQAFEIKKDNTDETETMAATIKTTSDTDMFAFAENHNLTVKNTDTPQTTALDEATATVETPETTVEQQQETPTDADGGDDGVTTQNFSDTDLTYGNFRYYINTDTYDTITIIKYTGSESTVTIPSYIEGKKVLILSDNVFTGNTTMKKVIIPGTVEWIEDAFPNCTALETVVLNEGTEVIGSFAFSDCTNLKTINIPESVRIIDGWAFYNCPNIDITKLISDKMIQSDDGDYTKCETVTYTGTEYYNLAQQVLTLVNQKRAANGLSALTMDTTWTEKAMKRAAELDLRIDHYGPNGLYCSGNGCLLENIGSGQTSAQEVVDDWMNSGLHKKAILDADAKCIGIGVWKNSTDSYAAMNWVMDTSAYPATSTCNTTGTKNATQTIYYTQSDITPHHCHQWKHHRQYRGNHPVNTNLSIILEKL